MLDLLNNSWQELAFLAGLFGFFITLHITTKNTLKEARDICRAPAKNYFRFHSIQH